jgi:hypothetical protein
LGVTGFDLMYAQIMVARRFKPPVMIGAQFRCPRALQDSNHEECSVDDREKGAVPPETAIPKTMGKKDRSRRLTIMILGDVRKVRTFKCSPVAIVVGAIFFCAYLVFSLIVLYQFFNLRVNNHDQSKRIALLEQESTMMRKARDQSQERVALLKDYLESIEGRRTEEAVREKEAIPPNSKVQSKPVQVIEPKSAPQGTGVIQSEPLPAEKIVDIRDMTLRIDGTRLLVDFKLYKIKESEPAIRGYVHIVVRDKNTSPPRELAFPYAELKNGIPVNYRRGQLFEIKRFKPIHGNFPLPAGSQSYSTVTVHVYDREGTPIYKKEFEVSDLMS